MVTKEAKLEIDEDKYVEQFKPYLMDVTLAWCKGATFAQICKMTDIFEGIIALSFLFLQHKYFICFLGSIIRCMRRLEEALRQCVQAAKTIGNAELEAKFAEGIRLIKRDIVFAASLYL
jgi:ATP-dependent RNA helicase DOB1